MNDNQRKRTKLEKLSYIFRLEKRKKNCAQSANENYQLLGEELLAKAPNQFVIMGVAPKEYT